MDFWHGGGSFKIRDFLQFAGGFINDTRQELEEKLQMIEQKIISEKIIDKIIGNKIKAISYVTSINKDGAANYRLFDQIKDVNYCTEDFKKFFLNEQRRKINSGFKSDYNPEVLEY